ncbi:MAG: hypothetical protein WC997_02015 [Porticoccaceae bacterium]
MPPRYRLLLMLLATALSIEVLAQTHEENASPPTQSAEQHNTEESTPPDGEDDNDTWLDASQEYVTTTADNVAEWMDDFFGDVHAEEDAPYSTLRLRFEQEWDQEDHFDSDVKLRGKVYLPNLNKRLSLLFNEEDTGETGPDDLLIDERDTTQRVTVQYRAKEEERYSVDYRVGIRSNLNIKTSVRARYRYPFSDSLRGTASEEVLYLGGDGFASKTRLELDKILSEHTMIQWHNKVDWMENEPGVTWASSLSLDKRLSDTKAYGYFIGMNGATKPEDIVHDYYVGVRYRQNMFRPWLFGEVRPSYRWSKAYPGAERENALVILFRLEMVFQRDLSD